MTSGLSVSSSRGQTQVDRPLRDGPGVGHGQLCQVLGNIVPSVGEEERQRPACRSAVCVEHGAGEADSL